MSVLCLFFRSNAHSQDHFVENRINSICKDLEERFEIQGTSIQIFNRESTLFTRYYGIQDHNTKIPINDSSIFYLGDLTKVIVASAIQNEVQKGNVQLDSSLAFYLPHLDKNSHNIRDIKVNELLYHKSGIQKDSYGFIKKEDEEEKSKNLKEPKMASKITKKLTHSIPFDTLKSTEYSNINYLLLVDIIETTNETSFRGYCQKKFFEPLELTSATFLHKENENLVSSYNNYAQRVPDSTIMASKKTFKRNSPYHKNSASIDGLYMNVDDLTKWMQYFLSLNKNTYNGNAPQLDVHKMWLPMSTIQSVSYWTINALKGDLAMGWHPKNILNTEVIISFSQDGGFKHFCLLLPEKELGITILTNTDKCPSEGIAYAILEVLIEEELIN